MSVAFSRVGDLADTIEVRGSRHAIVLVLLASTIGLLFLPPLISVLVLVGLLS